MKEDDAVVLFDSTIFGNGKIGMLMTHETLYALDKNGTPKQIDLIDIHDVSITDEQKGFLCINGKDFKKFIPGQGDIVKAFKLMLLQIQRDFKADQRWEFMQEKKNEVLSQAKNWWLHKPDPKNGNFYCDVCGMAIQEKNGTSLLGSYMRCPNCTRKLFSRWDAGED